MTSQGLLCADEPAPAYSAAGPDESPILVVCEHASARLPATLKRAYPEGLMRTHYGCDIGAGALAAKVAERLSASLVLANYSRVVIDCNRRLNDPTLILQQANGELVRANCRLSAADRGARVEGLYVPFHRTVSEQVTRISAQGLVPIYIAIHSFTPRLDAGLRPWDVGIMWDTDDRIAVPLIRALRRDSTLQVGDNEPYSGRVVQDFSVDFHAERNGYACVAIEVRQDHLSDDAGIASWADRLSAALLPIVKQTSLQNVQSATPEAVSFAQELERFACVDPERS
ncbi:MAG: N-formylglutamate amidohydrolase [Pseudomonadota bacterium]